MKLKEETRKAEMEVLMASALEIGSYKQEMRSHFEDGTCAYGEWSTREDIPEGMRGSFRHKEGEWQTKPST